MGLRVPDENFSVWIACEIPRYTVCLIGLVQLAADLDLNGDPLSRCGMRSHRHTNDSACGYGLACGPAIQVCFAVFRNTSHILISDRQTKLAAKPAVLVPGQAGPNTIRSGFPASKPIFELLRCQSDTVTRNEIAAVIVNIVIYKTVFFSSFDMDPATFVTRLPQ